MFSKSMKKAIDSAQECLNKTLSVQNVSIKIADNIHKFSELINIVDPTNIDFSNKSFFNKIKINKYWENYNQYHDEIIGLIREFSKQLKIVNNTIITLESQKQNLDKEFEIFSKDSEKIYSDIEYAQQHAVSENMVFVFNNILNEHKILLKNLENVVNISNSVFETSLLNAKIQYVNSIKFSEIDTYKQDFQELKQVLGLFK